MRSTTGLGRLNHKFTTTERRITAMRKTSFCRFSENVGLWLKPAPGWKLAFLSHRRLA